MRIIYLDQNKWIELACAVKNPTEFPGIRSLIEAIAHEVKAGHLALPLTSTNIYETQKINNPRRRRELAGVQAFFSRGYVFRGRRKRLAIEISDLLRSTYNLTLESRGQNWFLSDIFFEAFMERDDERLGISFPEKALNCIRNNPEYFLYDYMVELPDDVRVSAVRSFSDGSNQLRQRIENRRIRHKNEPWSMRKKIYGALLMIDEFESIVGIARKAGIVWNSVVEMGNENAQRIISEVPAYEIEREIALRLETEARAIEENDFRDMQSFCAVIPYADGIVAEKHFVNLAKQAKLDKKYGTRITTDIFALKDYLLYPAAA